MSKEDFIEAMGHVDDRILERYAKEEDRLNAKRPGKMWVRWVAAAACFAVIVSLLVLQKPKVPVYEDAIYSAQEIADLFGKKDSIGTNAYTIVPVPDEEYLYLHRIPIQQYLPIYQYNAPDISFDKSEFQTFLDSTLRKLYLAVGEAPPAYEIEDDVVSFNHLCASAFNNYSFVAAQNATRNHFSFFRIAEPQERIFLDGQVIQIDQTQTDREIISSLSETKKKLFSILGISFSDARVVREYDGGEHGVTSIDVYFYNKTDHPLNAWVSTYGEPYSDYLCISFNNFNNKGDVVVSDDILTRATVKYCQNRTDVTQLYQEAALAKLISLEEAEDLLYNGYVFGGHICTRCMESQKIVDFEDYDYVGLEYVFGRDDTIGEPTTGIPFYAFYKQIGTTENGNLIFAKTYVPAIEVSGYTEYFESQKEEHPS